MLEMEVWGIFHRDRTRMHFLLLCYLPSLQCLLWLWNIHFALPRSNIAVQRDFSTQETHKVQQGQMSSPALGMEMPFVNWGWTAWLAGLQERPGQRVQDKGTQCCIPRKAKPERQVDYCSYSVLVSNLGLTTWWNTLANWKESRERPFDWSLQQMKSKERMLEYVCSDQWRKEYRGT